MILRAAGAAALILLLIGMYASRFYYASPHAGTWDMVDFALALERFDLLAMQPHFPGYPYFILGGMWMRQWIGDPVLALSVFNVLMSLLSCFPTYWLARRRMTPLGSLSFCLFVQGAAYLWIISSQPMSEGTALAVLWWYLWSLNKGYENQKTVYQILPLLLFSILMGVRLSYAVFGVGILLLWLADWKRRSGRLIWSRFAGYAVIAAGFQAIWIAGLAYSEGGLKPLIQLATGFTTGHFSEWGGALTAVDEGYFSRFIRLLVHLVWVGMLGKSAASGVVLTGIIVVLCLRARSFWRSLRFGRTEKAAWIMWLVYLIYAFVAQNMDKPRHLVPLISLGLALAFLFLYRRAEIGHATVFRTLTALFVGLQLIAGFQFARTQASELPATYQLASGLASRTDDFIVYSWEEDRVLYYLQAQYPHKRVYTYEFFMGEIRERGDRKVLITDRVLKGFEAQGIPVWDRVVKTGEFRSDPTIEPVYSHVILYEWNNK
ncbi:nucleoporin-interacting protein [Paenibacillus tarimensis]